MSLRRGFFTKKRNTEPEADRSSLALPVKNDETHTYTPDVTTDGADSDSPNLNDGMRATNESAPVLSGRGSVTLPVPDENESSLPDTFGVADTSEVLVATTKYIYYRIYAEDGAIPSKTPAAPGDPFLGRIKARSVPPPPPHTVKAVRHCIGRMENIKDYKSTSLFLTPYSKSPMDDAEKFAIFNRTGPGSTPQEPLALVAKMSDSERSVFESARRGGLASLSAAEPGSDTTSPEIRYLYYLFYSDGCEIQSEVAIDPEEPSLGRIRADSVAPPHSPASIIRHISRVERTQFAHADLFANILCNTPLTEGQISILRTDCPGLTPNEPMAIVVQMEIPIPDGKYVIKNRAANIYWNAGWNPIRKVLFWPGTTVRAKDTSNNFAQWDITHDASGNIFMTSPYAPSSWVGAEITGSPVPVPWRLIPADSGYYYLTTDINRVSQNPRVPVSALGKDDNKPGLMATLKEGDLWQMWKFIRI